VSPK
jgi:hypothetical protein